MIKSIYKITKPNDPITIYIGSTKSTLKVRFQKHFAKQKLEPNMSIYQWLDKSCIIELIEVVEIQGTEKETIKQFEDIEYKLISEFKSNGFNVINYKDGRSKDDDYRKLMNAKINAKHGANNTAKRHPYYHNWKSKICRLAKQEGLTSKEYRIKYNISDYTGPKTLS